VASTGTGSDPTVAHFDRIADEYASMYERADTPAGYSFLIRRRRVVELFDRPGGRVLDVGCGPGVLVEALAERGCELVGVDPAVGMIELARAKHSDVAGAAFAVAAAERLGFPDGSFDAVVCTGVLERIADDEVALREMARVLRPGGSLLLSVPNRWSPNLIWRDHVFYPVVGALRPLYRQVRRLPATDVIRGHRRYSRRGLVRRLAALGLEVDRSAYLGYDLLPAPLNQPLPRLTVRLMRAAERLWATPLRATGAVLVVRAHRRLGRG